MTIQDVVSNSLKKGIGRALLVIRDNPDTDFSEIIFNACNADLLKCGTLFYLPQKQKNSGNNAPRWHFN